MATASGMPVSEIILNVVVGACVLLTGILLFSIGFFGGGDAKLLAAASLWMGLQNLSCFLYFTILAGGILALGTLLWVHIDRLVQRWSNPPVPKVRVANPSVPYGYAIAFGALIALSGS